MQEQQQQQQQQQRHHGGPHQGPPLEGPQGLAQRTAAMAAQLEGLHKSVEELKRAPQRALLAAAAAAPRTVQVQEGGMQGAWKEGVASSVVPYGMGGRKKKGVNG